VAREVNLPNLELPVRGDRIELRHGESRIDVVRLSDGVVVGWIELEDSAEGVFVRSLCIGSEDRSYGAGSEAAYLLNQALDAAGVTVTRAWAPPNLGLSVYFWSRMGYRPLHGEGPEGGLWFERRRE